MRHLFKCVDCGEFFEKKGPEVLCVTCAEKPQPAKPKKKAPKKK